jgi:hypothetical protein
MELYIADKIGKEYCKACALDNEKIVCILSNDFLAITYKTIRNNKDISDHYLIHKSMIKFMKHSGTLENDIGYFIQEMREVKEENK